MRRIRKFFGLVVAALVLGLFPAQAQRLYLNATGTGAGLGFSFAGQTSFSMGLALGAGARELAGPFGLEGSFGLEVQQGTAAFNLGFQGIFHFERYGKGISPLAGLGFDVFFGGNQTTFALRGLAGAEYFLNRQSSLVFTTEPSLSFAGQTVFGVVMRAGLRIYP